MHRRRSHSRSRSRSEDRHEGKRERDRSRSPRPRVREITRLSASSTSSSSSSREPSPERKAETVIEISGIPNGLPREQLAETVNSSLSSLGCQCVVTSPTGAGIATVSVMGQQKESDLESCRSAIDGTAIFGSVISAKIVRVISSSAAEAQVNEELRIPIGSSLVKLAPVAPRLRFWVKPGVNVEGVEIVARVTGTRPQIEKLRRDLVHAFGAGFMHQS